MGWSRVPAKGFTLIELLVFIGIIAVLKTIVGVGSIKESQVQEEGKNPDTGEVFMSLDTRVEVACPDKSRWTTSVYASDPGFILLPDQTRILLSVKDPLKVVVPSSRGEVTPEITVPEEGLVDDPDSPLTYRAQIEVAYTFSEVSGLCEIVVNAWVPRDRMFEDTKTFQKDGRRLWRARDAILHLNLVARLGSNPVSSYDVLDPDIQGIIPYLPADNIVTTFDSEVGWTVNSAFAGVLVGSGVDGSGISGVSDFNTKAGYGNASSMGCSLRSSEESEANQTFVFFVLLAAVLFCVVLVRQRQSKTSVKH